MFKLAFLCFSVFALTGAQNSSSLLYYQQQQPSDSLYLGEGALGGMIPTSIIVVLAAILRILQMYRQKQRIPQEQQQQQPEKTLKTQANEHADCELTKDKQ